MMTSPVCDLSDKSCKPCEGGVAPLEKSAILDLLKTVDGWEFDEEHQEIRRLFPFKNYYRTMAFVNAVAWMAHKENHHPDLEVSYNRCLVRYTTHAINGLSDNDFICAAKVNELLKFGPVG